MKVCLKTGQILQAVKDALATGHEIRCAVAYWGAGAKGLFVLPGKNGKILCDAESGATDPSELLKILKSKSGKFEIKSIRGLHAKVYLGATAGVVGSANASLGGLGMERGGNIEAAIYVDDPQEIAECHLWFDQLWNARFAKPVHERDLRQGGRIQKAWEQRKMNSLSGRANNRAAPPVDLLQSFFDDPDIVADVPANVMIYTDDLTPEAKSEIRKVDKDYSLKLSGYEDWKGIRPDSLMIDLMAKGGKTLRFKGWFYVLDSEPIRTRKMRIALATKVSKWQGYKLGTKGTDRLIRELQKYMNGPVLKPYIDKKPIPLSIVAELMKRGRRN